MEPNFNVMLTTKDFDKICRICLSKDNLKPFINQSILDMFKKITNIEVEQDEEKMPKNICSNCADKLNDIIYFSELANTTNQTLQEILNRTEYLYSPDITFSDNESLLDESLKKEVIWTDDLKVETPQEIIKTEHLEAQQHTSPRRNKRKLTLCKTCNQKFTTLKELRRHQKQNLECFPKKRTTQCQSCDTRFKTYKELRDHQRQNEKCKINKNKCLVCGKTFEATYKFKEHLRAHTNDTPYECKICNKKFKFAQNLRRHDKVSHKGIRPFRCDICGKVFARLERKLRHDKLHTMICGICKQVLRASEFPKHAEVHRLEGHSIEEAQYICRFCGNTFTDKSDYSKHLMEHRTNSIESTKECKIKCPICNKFYVSKYGLRSHMIIHVGKKEFLCNICGKAFLKKSSLDLHSSIHTDEKPYRCEDCGKTFRQQSSYNTHRLVHTGKRSYVCDICSKAFKQSTHLSRHYFVHTGEKPYKCTYCDKSFSQNCNLKTHTRTHTGETPYQCSICSKGFHDSSSLKKHEKNHIKNE